MTKRFLVTGGNGFIGAAMVRALVARGERVRVLDNNFRGEVRRLQGIEDSVEMIEGDVRDPATVHSAAKDIHTVVHLAFINGTHYFYSEPDLVMDVGIRGMLNVVDACHRSGCDELFVASSSEVYQTAPIIPTPEDVPLVIPNVHNPRFSYAAAKMLSEMLALHSAGKHLDRVVVFRPHNVYGPDMGWDHVIPEITARALESIEQQPTGDIDFEIQGDGSATRAFIYIDDCAEAIVTLTDKAEHLGVYHVGTTEERSIGDVARAVFKLLGRTVRLVGGESPAGSIARRCPDTSKLSSLGFEPRSTFEEGLRRTVNWYKDNAQLRPRESAEE